LPFSAYMRAALQEPGLGYYSAGSAKLGAAGDFVTAPELGPVFAQSLARQLADLSKSLTAPLEIVEFGAGSGRLAADVLVELERHGLAPRYRILETSADLVERQRQRLARFGERVQWLSNWPVPRFEGIVFANEVLDALPVECFVQRRGATLARGVTWHNGAFAWADAAAEPPLREAVAGLEQALEAPLPDGYSSEICLELPAWMRSVADALARGYLLLIDYGLVRREYYHPSRAFGTLTCHYRHRVHADPFYLPGLQDISAWVDFSACAAAAEAAGLAVAGFTTQAQFILHRCAAELAPISNRAGAEQARALATLVLPGEMGERFKLLLLSRNLARPAALPGRDFRSRL
jgi:SAM-dependent MidA family methyltransferase